MKFTQLFLLLSFLFTHSLWSATPVPYSGKIDIREVNYFGDAQFAFSLHDGNGTTHWRNGNQAGETIKVTIRNGRYNILLGGQGMNSLPAELFLNHDKLYLKVEVDIGDEVGLRHLAPDQLITATPRALVADLAKVSEVAKVAHVAEKVGNGAITRDMLSSEVLAKLDANTTASPSAPITITRDMLPQDVRDDLNKTLVITRQMLPTDVLADLDYSISAGSISLDMLAPELRRDLNRTITKSMLARDVLADLNKTISKSMLGSDVLADLDQSIKTITRDMLPVSVLTDLNRTITKSMLGSDVLSDLNKTISKSMLGSDVLADLDQSIKTITRDMLPASVLTDLNRTITKSMLGSDVLADLNKTISKSMLGSDVLTDLDQSIKTITRDMLPASVLTDLNRTITKSMLGSDVLADLNNSIGKGSITLGMLSSEVVTALKPAISRNPQSIISVEGVRALLEVNPVNGNVTYQWKKNGENVLGANLRVLEIPDLNASQHEGNYTVVVSNAFGSVISSVAEIDLNGSLTSGLVGWWKFDETNGTVAYDSSGNENDGNLTNGPTWTSGKIGGALSFDGVDDRVKIPHTILDQKLAFTVSLWFNMKLGSDSSYHAFITAANSSDANAFTFEKRPDHNMMIRDMGEVTSSPAETSDFWTSTWRHITLTKSSVGIVFYLSGEELDSKNYSTTTMNVDANGLWIGPDQDSVGGGWQSGQSVKGELDDFRIYDRALSPFEVRALHDLGEQPVSSVVAGSGTVVNGEVADGSVTASKLANNTITTSQLNEQILKYLKPEITTQPQAQNFYANTNVSLSVTAEGKYLSYQWEKDGSDLTGETNATLSITDTNATLHDGNYSVVVSNDFGSVESGIVEINIWTVNENVQNLALWLDASNAGSFVLSNTIIQNWKDLSGNGNDMNITDGNASLTGHLNGKTVAFYDGNDVTATTKKFSSELDQSGYSVVALSRYAGNQKFRVISSGYGLGSRNWLLGHHGGLLGCLFVEGWVDSGTTGDLNWHIFSATHESAISFNNGVAPLASFWLDGAIRTLNSGGSSDVAPAPSDIVFGGALNTEKSICEVAEFVMIAIKISDAKRQKIEGYLAHKWGLTSNLPSNHPYK